MIAQLSHTNKANLSVKVFVLSSIWYKHESDVESQFKELTV